MSKIQMQLLGYPEIKVDGQTAAFASRKAIALFIYLLVNKREQTRDHLVALFWTEADAKKGRSSLRYTLSILRKGLGQTVLTTTNQTVAISETAVIDSDLSAFATAVADQQFTAATTLYKGSFMAGFDLSDSAAFTDWQRNQAQRWLIKANHAFEEQLAQETGAGDWEQAIATAQRLYALDDLNEVALRTLMEGQATQGNFTEALRYYEQGMTHLYEELGVDPEPETLALHTRIVAWRDNLPEETVVATLTDIPHNTFVGRQTEQAEIISWLTEGERLVTILAQGGMGKTRLAQAVTQASSAQFEDGVAYVSLVSIHTTETMITAVARALGLSLVEGAAPRQQVHNHLQTRRLLLTLDNMEHLIIQKEPVEWLAELLQSAPRLQILATSRERLRLSMERPFLLDSLNYASEDDFAEQLFLDRAQSFGDNFDRRLVQKICQTVQGLPLAIELAAAMTATLSLTDILAQLTQNITNLASDLQDVPDRHRSMQGVFDQSWQALSPAEQEILAQLSVFSGGATLTAVQTITQATTIQLSRLINLSLVRREGARYQIHELLRQFSAEKLEKWGLTAVAQQKHATHYAAFLDEHKDTPDHITPEMDNIQAAWDWWLTQPSGLALAQLVPNLWGYYKATYRWSEAIAMLHDALAKEWPDEQTPLRHAEWIALLAEAYMRMGSPVTSLIYFKRALDLLGFPMPETDHALHWAILREIIYYNGRKLGLGQKRFQYLSPRHIELLTTVQMHMMPIMLSDFSNRTQLLLHIFLFSNVAYYSQDPLLLALSYARLLTLARSLNLNRLANSYSNAITGLKKDIEKSPFYPAIVCAATQPQIGHQPWAALHKTIEDCRIESKEIGDSFYWSYLYIVQMMIYLGQNDIEKGIREAARIHVVFKEKGLLALSTAAHAFEGALWAKAQNIEAARRSTKAGQAAAEMAPILPFLQFALSTTEAYAYFLEGSGTKAVVKAEETIHMVNQLANYTIVANVILLFLTDIYLAGWEQAKTHSGELEVNCRDRLKQLFKVYRQFAFTQVVGRPSYWLQRGKYYDACGWHWVARLCWRRGLYWARRLDMPFEEEILLAVLSADYRDWQVV